MIVTGRAPCGQPHPYFNRGGRAIHCVAVDPFLGNTATLSGLAYGQTVLAKACSEAGIDFDNNEAHSAAYDAERTAELFCDIVNRWKECGGWMPQFGED